MDNPAAAKVQLTSTPPLPAQCSVCGVHAKGHNDFADFGVSIDYYGAILICEDCIRGDLFALFDVVTRFQFNQVMEQLDEVTNLLAEERKRTNALRDYLASMSRLPDDIIDNSLSDSGTQSVEGSSDKVSAKSGK